MRYISEVRGVKFRGARAKEILESMQPGDIVQLLSEPTNKYDPNAVQIIAQDFFVGYVQADLAATVSALLSTDAERVSSCISATKPFPDRCYIEIRLREKASENESTRSEFA